MATLNRAAMAAAVGVLTVLAGPAAVAASAAPPAATAPAPSPTKADRPTAGTMAPKGHPSAGRPRAAGLFSLTYFYNAGSQTFTSGTMRYGGPGC